MKWVFWISVGMILYTYLGYPLILYLRCRWSARPVRSTPILPTISIIVAAYNEAHTLPDKLHNLSQLDYTEDRLLWRDSAFRGEDAHSASVHKCHWPLHQDWENR
jgi:cellulose synthase/poly-beta-1,6-N-acetylglucosamine synthase-like glycosyltransferase